MPELRPAGLIGSVERALGVLEAIAECGDGASAKAVARRAELPLPSAYRMLGTLHYHGYLIRNDDGSYGLGEQLATLYEHWYRKLDLDPAVRLILRDVHKRAGAPAYFGRLRDGAVTVVDAVDCPDTPRAPFTTTRLRSVGERSALGRALLSAVTDEERREFLKDRTPDPRLAHLLATARRTGVACDVGEFLPPHAGIAVPVRSPDGHLHGALAVTVPVAAYPDRRADVERTLRQCATTLVKLLAVE
ncbi:helix-turn-helix domain-containing protein [Longispora sp. K20-0274]|uniref:IclR family transcriptional regulator n=1 Tax=Longispora sp. K20-0274 TaxID=3088255 RepID=UPI003999B81C